ncbi:hypothetical protein BH23PLA1_BH23PLA1_31560 [soil metagenome]
MLRTIGIVGLGLLLFMQTARGVDVDSDLAQARQNWQVGRYAQALERYEAIENDLPEDDLANRARVAVGKAQSLASMGDIEEAIEGLRQAIEAAVEEKPSADVLATLADLEFGRGGWNEAREAAEQAIEANSNQLLARWVVARLLEAEGKKEQAIDAWRWFIDYQNANVREVTRDAEALLLIGQAAEKYFRARYRGEQLASNLNSVLNDIYEGAIKADSKCWQAAWQQGRLFLDGYREGDAKKELNRALLINPNAAEVLVTLGLADLEGYQLSEGRKKAEDALEINPRYAPAYILLADLNISDERFGDALEAARKAVELNPKDEEALGRLSASQRLLVNPLGAALAEAVARGNNPKPATFYASLGERLADRRKYHSAERAFLLAIEADPDRADSRIGLGMLYMQIGREPEARDLFRDAFAADPFNVRADNMIKVLRHLSTYEAIETENYIVLVDPTQDRLLGKYMSEYLEKTHKDLTDRFGFSPPSQTQIEILKNHQWFSGRTTGLPFIPTVGACTGKVVALASPKTTRRPYNWARVLTHEVAHVITLQQTDFNIPHWYTEALAVESEGNPRPQSWNKMLVERVPARRLLNLETINLGFIRPKEADERQLAYCQAQLYAQYMVKRFGEDSLFKLLDAYRRGLTTPEAVVDSFEFEVADFEEGYLDFLDEVIKTIRTRVDDEEEVRFSALQLQLRRNPEDADLNARIAYEYFARRDYKEARPYADKALELKEHHPLASWVKARLFLFIGDDTAALQVLEPAFDPDEPNERVVDLLAELKMKEGDLDEAERLYELARQDDPLHSKWIAGLARVHLRQGNEEAFLNDLKMLAENDADDLSVRSALARRYLENEEYAEAERWATDCLYIDVYDSAHHVVLADARVGLGNHEGAIEEYEVALTLEPKRPDDLRVKVASSLAALGRMEEALATLDEILDRDPGHPEAKALRSELAAGG